MSREGVDGAPGVRTVVVAAPAAARTWEDRILVRFPRLARLAGAAYLRLPPRTRLRRALTARNARRVAAAFNRRDLGAVLPLLDPDVRFESPESVVGGYLPPDMPRVHRGHDGYARMLTGLLDVWGDLELQPQEVLDFGDQVLVIGRIRGHGRQSGVTLDAPLFQLLTLRRGLICRQRDFSERDAALAAAAAGG